jgi:hypothetical protein
MYQQVAAQPSEGWRCLLIDDKQGGEVSFGVSSKELSMQGLRIVSAGLLSLSLAMTPVWGAPGTKSNTALGTVVVADRASVGDSSAGVGTTVFSGDVVSTADEGSMQLRVGAARLHLTSASSLIVNDVSNAPSAKLLRGTATFSTASANAFTLYYASAAVRPLADGPTVGRVSYLSSKEFIVRAMKGDLNVSFDGQTETIHEGTAFRVILDPSPAAQGPEGAGAGKKDDHKISNGPPLRAGRSRFLIVAVAAVTVVTVLGISEALESPARP